MEQNKIIRPLGVIETEINFYKQQTATGIIEIGKRLIEAKSQLEHGQWSKWLEEKVDFTDRTAQRFMKVANEFPTSMSGLGSGKLFKLLDVPLNQREEFILEHDIESLTTRQLQEEIKKVKEEIKKESDNLLNQKEQEYIKQKKELEEKLNIERNKQPKIIDNTDYNTINKLKSDLSSKEKDIEFLKRDKDILERKVKLNEEDAKKYNDLKNQIDELTHTREDIKRQIDAATSISGLIVEIDNLIKTKLAPVKYSKAILEAKDDKIVINNLSEIIDVVKSWCEEMCRYLPNNNIIEMEVLK
jgi:DNA repair exonuclease SbcCD ATPase subunit